MKAAVIKQISILGLVALLTACGGGGGGGGDAGAGNGGITGEPGGNGNPAPTAPPSPAPVPTPQPNSAAPTATILFPPPLSQTDFDSIIVRGTAQDPDGTAISAIEVNGVPALSNDNFATWQVTLPLQLGENTLVVATADAEGNNNAAAASVVVQAKAFPAMQDAPDDGVVVDTANNRALVVDGIRNALYAFDLASGERTVISSNEGIDNFLNQSAIGGGTNLSAPGFMTLDSANQRVLLKNNISSGNRATLAIDLNTGERSILLDQNNPGGSGPSFDLLRTSALDSDNNRLLVMDGFNGNVRLIALDLSSGDREIISGNGIGSGPDFNTPIAIALDAANNRLFAGDRINGFGKVFAVDLDTGARTFITGRLNGSLIGNGPELAAPISVKLDSANNRLLVADAGTDSLFLVDITSGDRTEINGNGPEFLKLRGADFFGTQQAIAVDDRLETPVMVDLITGNRQLLPGNAIGSGPRFETFNSLAANGSRLIVSEPGNGRLLAVDPSTGDRTVLVDDPEQFNFKGLDADQTRVFVMNTKGGAPQLLELDPNSNELTVISSAAVGTGINFEKPEKMVYHSELDRVFVTDSGLDMLIAVNPTTGERLLVSDNKSSGVGFVSPTDVAINSAGTTALVLDSNLMVVFSVDLASGARTIITGKNPVTNEVIGSEFGLLGASALMLDEANNRVLVAKNRLEGAPVVIVNLANGEQTELFRNSDRGFLLLPLVDDLTLDTATGLVRLLESRQQSMFAVDVNTEERVVVSWTDIN